MRDDVCLKLWEILSRLSKTELEKLERHTMISSSFYATIQDEIDFNEQGAAELDNAADNAVRPSKRDLILRIMLGVYQDLARRHGLHLDGSANYIVPALARKPFGKCPWLELERELSTVMRPSTFAQKIRGLTLVHALVFVIRGENNEKVLVIPEEALPLVRGEFALAPQLPGEAGKTFGQQLSPRELRACLAQVPDFTLQVSNTNDILELALKKQPGKTGHLLIPATATFEELHAVLQKFAGWHDEHFHEFRVKVVDPEPDTIVVDGLDPDGNPVETSYPGDYREDQVQIGQLLSARNNTVSYLYDFGERRSIKGKVLRVLPRDEDTAYPHILRVKRQKTRAHPNRGRAEKVPGNQ